MLLMRIMYHWQDNCVNEWRTLGVHFYIHVVQFMCLSNAAKNSNTYGAFEAMIVFATFYIYFFYFLFNAVL